VRKAAANGTAYVGSKAYEGAATAADAALWQHSPAPQYHPLLKNCTTPYSKNVPPASAGKAVIGAAVSGSADVGKYGVNATVAGIKAAAQKVSLCKGCAV
jgi:hypothetical protein